MDQLPKCSKCGGLLRPAVIWFGENLDSNVMRKATAELEKCDICLVIGTSSVVYPAAMFAPQVSSVIKTEWNYIMHLCNVLLHRLRLEEYPWLNSIWNIPLLQKNLDFIFKDLVEIPYPLQFPRNICTYLLICVSEYLLFAYQAVWVLKSKVFG